MKNSEKLSKFWEKKKEVFVGIDLGSIPPTMVSAQRFGSTVIINGSRDIADERWQMVVDAARSAAQNIDLNSRSILPVENFTARRKVKLKW